MSDTTKHSAPSRSHLLIDFKALAPGELSGTGRKFAIDMATTPVQAEDGER